MDSHLYDLLIRLLSKNDIRVDNDELKLQLLSHPSYPSLHSITGVLDHFGIPNAALKVPVTVDVLEQTPKNFLATVKIEDHKTLVLVEKKKKSIVIQDQTKKARVFSPETFLNNWNGIILAIEKDETVTNAEKEYSSKLVSVIFSVFALGGIGLFCYQQAEIFPISHFVLSILGLITSVFIVKHELGLQSGKANSFCNITPHTSCDAVMQSKGATVFGRFRLSDISIVVFATFITAWMVFTIGGFPGNFVFTILSLLALPVVGYSIFYQWRVVNKWCPLCLSLGAILLLQFVSIFSVNVYGFGTNVALNTSLIFVLVLVFNTAAWATIKRLIQKKATLKSLEIAHYKFKRNFSLFNTLYEQGTSVSHNALIPGEIVLGRRNAPINLTLVTSPFCGFCKKAHTDIEKLLKNASDTINVRIRFLASSEDRTTALYKLAHELVRIYNENGEASCLNALSEVYAPNVDLQKWMVERKLESDSSYDAILDAQSAWAAANSINFTPALYVNNIAFPKEYDRTDLQFLLDDMVANRLSGTDTMARENKAHPIAF